jgi:hypothetical protein
LNRPILSTLCIVAIVLLAYAAWPKPTSEQPEASSWSDQQSGTGLQAEDSADSIQAWSSPAADHEVRLSGPGGSGFENLPESTIRPILPEAGIPEISQAVHFGLAADQSLELTVMDRVVHANGDTSIHAGTPDPTGARATLTYGQSGLFGRIRSDQGLFLVHTDANGSWLLDLNDQRLDVDPFHNDTMGQPVLHPLATQHRSESDHLQAVLGAMAVENNHESVDQIDVMFVYTPDMIERYPGDLIETRLNHLVAIANQAMVDSQVPIAVRLVHHQMISYSRHQDNREAIVDMVRALRGQAIPGMGGLHHTRRNVGADIVALTWPHNIETRGSCGLAYFPQPNNGGGFDDSYAVHIDNDGASNWSICSDAVFTHELGHNLNAEHQRSQSSGDDPDRSNYAFIEPGRFHTVMGSFGTGDFDRYLRLDVFSNPEILCGGAPCGSTTAGQGADNATTLTQFAPIVSAYALPTQAGQVQRPPPSDPDSDGDGVSDWLDPYPFDPHNGQPPPDTGPAFVFSERALAAGLNESEHEMLVLDSDNDRILAFDLEGRLRAVVAEPEPRDRGPNLTEFSNMLVDEQGMVYVLASGDVRRFDRMSGQLVDVFLGSQRPEPNDLLSPFPRAIGSLFNQQLVVLGDFAIERYDFRTGQRRHSIHVTEPTQDPGQWNQRMDLALRAMATRPMRLYVAEATQNRIMAFATDNGQRLADVAPADNGHIIDPRDLVTGPDGLLYVANGQANNIVRFNPVNIQFAGTFVATGSGGLDFARALAFGPDGHLYVASRNTAQILRFDGQSGQFMDVVVEAGAHGLSAPESIVFAPVVNQVHAGHSGHYIDPERSGEGWLIEILDAEAATMSWFTYAPGGEPAEQAWMVGVGQIDGNRIIYDDVLITEGMGWGSDFDTSSLELSHWGRVEVEFSHCDHATLRYDGPPAFGDGRRELVRLISIHGLPCGSEPSQPLNDAPGISGQWYDEQTAGQGWFFEEIAPGLVFVAWYSYDLDGHQAWVVGVGELDNQQLHFEELIITQGTRFGDQFSADDVERVIWGEMSVTFTDCNQATLDYSSVLPGYGSGSMNPVRLSRLDGLACELD